MHSFPTSSHIQYKIINPTAKMTVLAILLLALLHILLFFLLHNHQKKGKNTHLPGPLGLPFLGNLHQIDNSKAHIYLGKLAKKYGPLMIIRLGSKPVLVVSSAKMVKEVMKTYDIVFCSRPPLLGQQKLSYSGLDVAFGPSNDYWREMRKIFALHLFSSKKIPSFRPICEDEVSGMLRKISKLSVSMKIVNLSEIAISLTSSLICRIAFGKGCNDEEYDQQRRFHGLLGETQAMMGSFFFSDYFPLLGWVDKVNGMCARLEKIFKDMDSFYQKLIDGHLSPNRQETIHDDFLDILLGLKKDQLSPVSLTFDHIKANLLDVLTGGIDTGATTVIWVMTALMKRPELMRKVQEEVRKLVAKKELVDDDDIQKLPYLAAVIKETMRLHPPIPLIPRETLDKCVLDGYEIPPKMMVYVNVWAIGRDPEAWKNPEEFLPERFLDSTIDFKGQDFELIPFGSGRRGCPGLNLGIAIVQLALANLLYSFDWELPDGMKREDIDTDVMPGITMRKKNDLCLMARNYLHN